MIFDDVMPERFEDYTKESEREWYHGCGFWWAADVVVGVAL